MLDQIFLQLLNMSFTASIIILFVLAVRLLLRRAPKIFSYALWSVALFRLVCPFSFESVLSLLPTKSNPIPLDITQAPAPQIDTGLSGLDQAVNAVLPAPLPQASANPLQIWIAVGSIVWLAGVLALLAYSLETFGKLRGRLKGARQVEGNLYEAESLETPFVLGLFRPRIYLPAGLGAKEKEYILLHERAHIKRFDHGVKLLSFFVLCLHWFNPLVWAAFFLSGKDMEMSCDEAVIRRLGNGIKKEYSSSLLSLATGRRIVGGTPLAFGEGDTKSRIKNVLSYKKPAFWVILVALIVVVALVIGLLANPRQKADTAHTITFPASQSGRTENNSEIFDIEPFAVSLELPEGWTIGDRPERFPMMGAWSLVGIYNADGEAVGAAGYNVYEEYEGAEDEPQAIYSGIALGNGYHFNAQPVGEDDQPAYVPVRETEHGVTATTTVYYMPYMSEDNGYGSEEHWNKGVLSYDRERLVYTCLEFDADSITDAELKAVAMSLEFAGGETASGKPIADLTVAEGNATLSNGAATVRLVMNSGRFLTGGDVAPGGGLADENYVGSCELQVSQDGTPLSSLSVPGAGGGELVFNEVPFTLQMRDYNGDGSQEFAIGQWGSSSIRLYTMYSVGADGSLRLVSEPYAIAASDGLEAGQEYSPAFEPSESGFTVRAYNNAIGEDVPAAYVWDEDAGIYWAKSPAGQAVALSEDTAKQFIEQTLRSLMLRSDNTVSFTLPAAIPTDDSGQTKLYVSMSATFTPEPGTSSIQEMLDWKTDWHGGDSYVENLDLSRGKLTRLFLRVAFMTAVGENSYQEYAADYVELIEPFQFDAPVSVTDRRVEITEAGAASVLTYTLQNGDHFSVTLILPEGLALSASENYPEYVSSPDYEMPAVVAVQDGKPIGTLTLSGFGTNDKAILAQIDTAENTIPMPIFAAVALSNHAEFVNYEVCKSSNTGANATAEYTWQDLTGYGGNAPDAPWLKSDCVLAYDYEEAPFFLYLNLTKDSLSTADLVNLAKSIDIAG